MGEANAGEAVAAGGARAGGGGSRGAGAAGAVRWPCAGSWRQRCSTAGKPRWAPPSPCPSFFSWQRPTSGASYRAQPLPFAYVQARRAPRWGAEPAPFASQRSRVWRECEQRESRPTARAGSGVIRVPRSASAPVTVTRCRGRSALAPPGAFPGLCPGTGRSRRSGRGRGPRSPQGAALQPIGRKAPGRAAAANGSCGST